MRNSPCWRTRPAEVGLWVALNVVQAGQMFLKGGRYDFPSEARRLLLPGCKWSGISGVPPALRSWLCRLSVMLCSLWISYCRFVTKSFIPSQLRHALALTFACATAAWWAACSSACWSLKALIIAEPLPFEQLSDSLPPVLSVAWVAPPAFLSKSWLGSGYGTTTKKMHQYIESCSELTLLDSLVIDSIEVLAAITRISMSPELLLTVVHSIYLRSWLLLGNILLLLIIFLSNVDPLSVRKFSHNCIASRLWIIHLPGHEILVFGYVQLLLIFLWHLHFEQGVIANINLMFF